MENKKDNKRRWFLIKHECGSILTVDPERFYTVGNEQDYINYDLRCPSCQKTIDEDTVEMFRKFISRYKVLIKVFSEKGFTLREISNQDLNSLPSQ